MLAFLAVVSMTQALPVPSYKAERIALYAAAAADILTTRNAIINGGTEGNPLLAPIIGKTPSTLKLVAAKAVSIAITELAARYHRKRGNHGMAKFLYWMSVVSWSYASGFNLRFAFK